MPDKIVKTAVSKAIPGSKTHIYITRKTKLYPLLKKVRRQLILENAKQVTICGTGAAIAHASSLALKIQDMIGGEVACTLDVRTGTQETHDDIEPENEDEAHRIKLRNMNVIQIDIIGKKK